MGFGDTALKIKDIGLSYQVPGQRRERSIIAVRAVNHERDIDPCFDDDLLEHIQGYRTDSTREAIGRDGGRTRSNENDNDNDNDDADDDDDDDDDADHFSREVIARMRLKCIQRVHGHLAVRLVYSLYFNGDEGERSIAATVSSFEHWLEEPLKTSRLTSEDLTEVVGVGNDQEQRTLVL
ncbi:hypothetical protein M0802_009726 [Mischocyttarus mexicanus]|nr:hypothetical protein M0802_009726 [Mischocyttarus mexicanus]